MLEVEVVVVELEVDDVVDVLDDELVDVVVVELEVEVDELVEVLVVVVEEEVEVVVVEVDVVISTPSQTAPSYRIQKLVSVSKNSSPALGLVGTALCCLTAPLKLPNLLVIMF